MKALGTLRFTIGLLVILIAVGFYLWFSGDPLTGSWFAWLSLSAGIVAGAAVILLIKARDQKKKSDGRDQKG